MPLPHRLRDDSQTWAARMGPLAQGDHDGLRGISSPPEDGRDRPLSGAHAGRKRCYRRDTAGAGRPRDRGEGSGRRLRQLRGGQSRREARRLSATYYAEWVLGTSRGQTALHIVTEHDPESGAILARTAFHTDYGGA